MSVSKLAAISSLIYGSYRFLSTKQTKIAHMHNENGKWYQKQIEYWDVSRLTNQYMHRNKRPQSMESLEGTGLCMTGISKPVLAFLIDIFLVLEVKRRFSV